METNRLHALGQIGVDAVVELAPGVAGVHPPAGGFVPKERLGPGVVKEIGNNGTVHIHWVGADLDTWVEPSEVEVPAPAAHLIVIYRCNAHGDRALERYEVVTRAGLTHNWTVEWLPENVIRTVRSDGLAWTFDWYPWFHKAEPLHTILYDALSEEDHAEALAVAELAAP